MQRHKMAHAAKLRDNMDSFNSSTLLNLNVKKAPIAINIGDNGESGFEQLRKCSRNSQDLFRDVIAILDERAELEFLYAKSIKKLAARLVKACKSSYGKIDSSWKYVADSFEGEGTIHRSFGQALKDEIVQPLRSVYEAQQKSKKNIEHSVDKALKKMNDKRSEQLKMKRNAHSLARDCEKVQRVCQEELQRSIKIRSEKQLSKLQAKRFKLEENVLKAENNYKESAVEAERERAELETILNTSASKMEAVEEQRLANLQTALGRYQRHLMQFGPSLTQTCNRHMVLVEDALGAKIQTDLRTMVAQCQPKQLAFRSLILCDFYAEDFSQLMDNNRRRQNLQRLLGTFETELVKERKGREGLQHLSTVYDKTPAFANAESRLSLKEKLKDSCNVQCFLEYHLYKIQSAMLSAERRGVANGRITHELAKYEERHKDKAGLRQTVLRIPLCKEAEEEANRMKQMNTDRHLLISTSPLAQREQGDGQSPPNSSPVDNAHDDAFHQDPMYESLDQVLEDSSTVFDESESEMSSGSSLRSTKKRFSHSSGGAQWTFASPEAPSSSSADSPTQVSTTDDTQCTALYDFVPQREDELELKAGDQINIYRKLSSDWWEGCVVGVGKTGLFPTNYISLDGHYA